MDTRGHEQTAFSFLFVSEIGLASAQSDRGVHADVSGGEAVERSIRAAETCSEAVLRFWPAMA